MAFASKRDAGNELSFGTFIFSETEKERHRAPSD